MKKAKITIVGAGIIGLAIAEELSKQYTDIVVLEKNSSFGEETSSRNSEVIHAGIYYPKDSLKARMCVEGKELLYKYCIKNNIGHKKIGKLIIAVNDDELKRLENLYKHGIENGVADLRLLSKDEIKKLEPHIVAKTGIYSPSTGILDSKGLMGSFVLRAKNRNVNFIYEVELEDIKKYKDRFKVLVKNKKEQVLSFFTETFINAAGLNSDRIAKMAGIDKKEYTLKYCKGDYFRVHKDKAKFLSRLIYTVPGEHSVSLGIHTALDLKGNLRLGPDAEYVEKIDYNVDELKRKIFYEKTKSFLPFIELEDLTPDMSGIRAKLQGQGETFRDFVIKDETDNGLAGFINLIGIDSPGLTCCISIAEEVKKIIRPFF